MFFFSNLSGFSDIFLGVLEGLGSSGRLIGTISTYPGTHKCPWSRVIAENPSAFLPSTSMMRNPYAEAVWGIMGNAGENYGRR